MVSDREVRSAWQIVTLLLRLAMELLFARSLPLKPKPIPSRYLLKLRYLAQRVSICWAALCWYNLRTRNHDS
jgi:hypothetical protein